MVCDPAKTGEAACATQILSDFASRAFRRPVAAAESAATPKLVDVAKSVGDGFEQGIAAGLQAILLSPRFLFRVEANPGAGHNAPLDDYEVASRLSYFLWSSMPDDALFARAAGGALHDARVDRRRGPAHARRPEVVRAGRQPGGRVAGKPRRWRSSRSR